MTGHTKPVDQHQAAPLLYVVQPVKCASDFSRSFCVARVSSRRSATGPTDEHPEYEEESDSEVGADSQTKKNKNAAIGAASASRISNRQSSRSEERREGKECVSKCRSR